ncbi:sensor histidine kinase [Chryseosolibacter indicus]|uniref:histidine kinase n=1 Tax=Chryseosolibacter indicus TaxID=2782351 RepID=A0ABS5VWN5_9BACT|nr:HAMP domain-containing sensor histidine kinase [Chryseosolibacter indicus]MBT1705247.1 HAMP domain-containing histidine kinase [Chryseosolibacter indicus]
MSLNKKSILYFIVFILFLSAGLVTAHFFTQPQTAEEITEEIAIAVAEELKEVDKDLEWISKASPYDYYEKADEFQYPVFIFINRRLIYWSDNKFIPPAEVTADSATIGLITTGSEAYLLRKKFLDDGRVIVASIQLLKKYPINNNYLTPQYNKQILLSENVNVFDLSATSGTEVCVRGKCFFRISFQSGDIPAHRDLRFIAFAFLSLAIVALILLIYSLLPTIRKRYYELGLIYLLAVFYLLRIIMTQTAFLSNVIIDSPLFDPLVFASSSLNPSLADLVMNLLALLALGFYLFRNYFKFHLFKYTTSRRISWYLGILYATGAFFSLLFPIVVIQTLYNNSTIVLDITQSLKFDGLRIVAIISLLLSGVCAFLFSHAFIRMLVALNSSVKIFISLIAGAGLFSLINEYTGQQYLSTLILSCGYFLIIYWFHLYKTLKRLTFETFAYLFAAIFFLSLNGALAIQSFTHKERIENQFRFASNFLIDRDYFGEYLLHEASQKIAKDVFTQKRLISPFLGKDAIRQKIRHVFLSSYFNKYDVDIHIFNSLGEPVDNSNMSFSEFVKLYDKDSYKTQYEGIYFVNNPHSDVTQEYLIKVPIRRSVIRIGYVIVQLSLKKIIPENVYPELLVDYRSQQSYRTGDLNYAIFSGKSIVLTSGNFNYDRFFPRELLGSIELYTKGVSFAGYDHIAEDDQNGRIAVVSAKQIPFTYKLSNFSFLLVLGLFIVLILIFFQGIYQYFLGGRLFFSARIQLYLNLAFFIPLIIVSISTLGLASRSSQGQLDEEYISRSKVFSQQIIDYLDEVSDQKSSEGITLSNRVSDLAKLSNLDANVYSPQGYLVATSQPQIFESNLISNYVNSRAYERIKRGENFFIESERVGTLQYFVSYAVLKSSQTGNIIGILGIPFFQSSYMLEKIQSVALINILNIFAFIFIILLILSYVVAGSLTFPLRFITQSLRKTSLNNNTPLTWEAQDEIGLMVKEYNSMLYKLSESKTELEQTQREKAWREIAQQVAHEIKNPLTPMKLTLQQLERNVQQGNNTTERTQRAISTLLTAVETLNDIASSFSGFVKMPAPIIQELDIVTTVKRAVDLHSPTGEISFKSALKEAWVLGDNQLLSRTFSNIILNALQSGKVGQHTHVHVRVEKVYHQCRISFVDNGNGMEPEVAERIFLPHFTTKKSGSGLGLAIAKHAIEQMKGRIWFETQIGKGSSFYIDLPLLK